MSNAKEAASFVGVGVLKKWTEESFARKTKRERNYIAQGMDPVSAAQRAEAEVEAEETISSQNSLTIDHGAHLLLAALTGGTITIFNGTNSYVGVGDNSTANPSPNNLNDLQATTNKVRVVVDATYPTVGAAGGSTSNVGTWRMTADGNTANFAWNEWAIFNAASAGDMLNRAVQAFGTKASGTVWQLTTTITIS